MYKLIKIFSLMAVVFALFSIAIPSEAAKQNVAIIPLDNNSDTVQTSSESIIYKLVAENMGNQLVVAFHNSDDYAVVDREKVNKTLTEIGIQAGGAVAQEQAETIGKKLNAQYSVVGKILSAKVVENKDQAALQAIKEITEKKSADDEGESAEVKENEAEVKIAKSTPAGNFEGKITVELKFLNNETGEVVFFDEVNNTQVGINGANALRAACKAAAEDFIAQIAKKAPLQTEVKTEEQSPPSENTSTDISVIYVEGDVLYIDKGKDSGIKVGDMFVISKKAVPITDMDGKVITVRTSEVGKALVTEVNKSYSICKIIERNESDSIKRGCTAKKTDD